MTRFPLRVLKTIRRYGLISPGDRVAVALSGGADSMALLHVLHELLPRLEATLAGVIHVHHGLRAGEADLDLDWCRGVALGLGVPFREARVAVSAEAQVRGWSIERTAHLLRHAAFRETAAELGAHRIALGHTRDDQAETVVLRFLRGAGTRGMGGMHPKRGLLIRPLLETSRAHVEQFLVERGLTYREDASNADVGIPRNRVRHEVLPLLTRVAGRGLPARLARQADRWRADDDWLEQSAVPLVERAVTHGDRGWRLDLDALREAPDTLRGRVLLALARHLAGDRATTRTVDDIERFMSVREGRRGQLGRWTVVREGAHLHFEPVRAAETEEGEPAPTLWLPVPGTVNWKPDGRVVMAVVADRRTVNVAPDALGPTGAMVDADEVGGRLVVRAWQPGDALRPIGLGGSQKLQDVFVNRKVPRHDRRTVPIVAMPDGRIVWVAGIAVDEAFAVSPTTTRVVILRATHPGGKA